MTTAEAWLTSILDCGIADLSILDDVEYCIDDVLKTAKEYGNSLTLGTVMAAVFDIGRNGLQDAIDDRLAEIEASLDESECHENEEYRALLSLNPYDDTNEFHNFLDTHIWFIRNEEVYRKYLMDACNEFEQNTGFSLFE